MYVYFFGNIIISKYSQWSSAGRKCCTKDSFRKPFSTSPTLWCHRMPKPREMDHTYKRSILSVLLQWNTYYRDIFTSLRDFSHKYLANFGANNCRNPVKTRDLARTWWQRMEFCDASYAPRAKTLVLLSATHYGGYHFRLTFCACVFKIKNNRKTPFRKVANTLKPTMVWRLTLALRNQRHN